MLLNMVMFKVTICDLKNKDRNMADNIGLFANFGAHNAQLQNSLRKFYIKC